MSAMFRIPIRPDFELRLCTYNFAVPAYVLVEQNRDYLRRWLPWVDQTWSPDDISDWIRRGLEQLQRNEGWQAALWYREELAGFVGFKPVDWPNMRTEIGYWLGAAFQGNGLMTDAVRAATDHAFREWGLNRIEIRCSVNNHRSAAIPTRLGYVREGVLRQAFKVGDEFQDLQIFAMLREDWPR